MAPVVVEKKVWPKRPLQLIDLPDDILVQIFIKAMTDYPPLQTLDVYRGEDKFFEARGAMQNDSAYLVASTVLATPPPPTANHTFQPIDFSNTVCLRDHIPLGEMGLVDPPDDSNQAIVVWGTYTPHRTAALRLCTHP